MSEMMVDQMIEMGEMDFDPSPDLAYPQREPTREELRKLFDEHILEHPQYIKGCEVCTYLDDKSEIIDAPDPANIYPNECHCPKAVKIKDGGQICQVCGKDAYGNIYAFDHMPEGIALLKAAGKEPKPVRTIQAQASTAFAERHGEPPTPATLELIAPAPAPPAQLASDPPKPKERKKREPKPKAVKTVNPFLDAVRFIDLAQRPKGDDVMTHCCLAYGGISASDRTISAGSIIPEESLMGFPETALLRIALEKCGHEYKIIQYSDRLLIQSGDFSAYIPMADPAKILTVVPDPNIAPLGPKFIEALRIAGKLVKDDGKTLMQMCVQLNPHTVIACNGAVIIEAFHGYDMPPTKMLVPKRFIDVLAKSKKEPVGFGFGRNTFSVHCTDRSWMKSNLFDDKLPYDLNKEINRKCRAKCPVPEHFFEAAAEVANWSTDGRVYCFDGRISSHPLSKQDTGSVRTYQMNGFAENRIYASDALKLIASHAVSMDFDSVPKMTFFFGNDVRGAIMHETIETEIALPIQSTRTTICRSCGNLRAPDLYGKCDLCGFPNELNDDDIPF